MGMPAGGPVHAQADALMGPVLERFTIGLPVKLHFGPANRILVVQNRLGAVERGY